MTHVENKRKMCACNKKGKSPLVKVILCVYVYVCVCARALSEVKSYLLVSFHALKPDTSSKHVTLGVMLSEKTKSSLACIYIQGGVAMLTNCGAS